MPLIRAEAIVLQSFPYSETSKILRLATRTHGIRSAIARGALRPRSRFGGVLEPFTEGVATLYLKDGRELQTLSGFDLVRSGQGLGHDLLRFAAASLLAELVLRTASEESEPALFDQLRGALWRLADVPADRLNEAGLAEAWALVGCLGFAPILTSCVQCGRPLQTDEDTAFDYLAGGARCNGCGGASVGRHLPAGARRDLARLCGGEMVPLAHATAHWALLARFISHHLTEDARAIRSLSFLNEMMGRE